ncbi:Bifunctional adenosylcobalaminbiosynthesisprotein CobU [Corynebacterium pseudotuberculosis]|uniref:bifunctional adenosylcobinamide kinase/adenosylcobinamide-phosphate guanylyltransferase n=1 Tax=Corynebacterium pseudotuberculosis TaxID=1719 RepID=UPI000CDC3BE5|nr:bifunctional adenosylcobinamide kinase/adenosylcobinamide-phosphate guanylyltransferase [Corynebacterium pseudotuberculosis]AUZ43085.1 Bifunctional adenosylcobalaminbiosynthesisprotein CobU [Corynebacterium pseudotuberculosis]
MRTLVLGGARSGKSAFAEALVGADSCRYIATARPYGDGDFDADFQRRISQHVQRRPSHWATEDRADLCEVFSPEYLRQYTEHSLLVDDLGTWLTHLIDIKNAWDSPTGSTNLEAEQLTNLLRGFPTNRDVVLVTPEVGMGIIPAQHSGRLFRDEIGTLNHMIADVCDQVFLVIAGQPLQLKSVL